MCLHYSRAGWGVGGEIVGNTLSAIGSLYLFIHWHLNAAAETKGAGAAGGGGEEAYFASVTGAGVSA